MMAKMTSDNSESQETTSTSLSDYSLNLCFEDINYTVRPAVFVGGRKTILKDVCGTFNSGELTVIVGQSGAGKSSLLDILAGYTKPTRGRLYVNGRLRNEEAFRRRSCYLMQDDQLQNKLTVLESLSFAAELRLGNHVSNDQKKKRINEIVTSLGLAKTQNTNTCDLSGGQRKRLAIGLELITDPPVMFLDEPTSGVDSSITKQIIYLLHQLSRQGRTIVMTMHQPSALLLPMIDKLYAMVDGRCAYMGSVVCLLPYLQQANLTCPPYHNPIDFLIEVSTENANELVLYSENGKSTIWSDCDGTENPDYHLTENFLKTCDEVCLTTLPLPKEDPTAKILLALKSTYPTSFWKQFATLTRRSILSNWRDPAFTITITGIHFATGLFIGILFYNIGQEAKYVRSSVNMLCFSLMFILFTAFNAGTNTFPLQMPVVRREHFNGWYSTGAYYISTLASILPTLTVCTLVFSCVAYWLTGQPPEFIRFLGFLWTLMMVAYVSVCFGLLNGSILSIEAGVMFGNFFILPFLLFSGFFLRYSETPFILKWMFHISFVKHGIVGLVLSVYGMDRQRLPCSDIYCHYTVPKQLIKDMDMLDENYLLVVGALSAIGSTVLLLSYFILRIRLKHKW